jgi:hypothetical protein
MSLRRSIAHWSVRSSRLRKKRSSFGQVEPIGSKGLLSISISLDEIRLLYPEECLQIFRLPADIRLNRVSSQWILTKCFWALARKFGNVGSGHPVLTYHDDDAAPSSR